MQKIFEKIKERLKLEQGVAKRCLDFKVAKTYGNAIEIVNQVAEEYSNSEIPNMSGKVTGSDDGWIPVSSGKLPDTNEAVNITWVNRKPPSYYADKKDKPFTATGHYHNGRWYWYSCVCKDYLDEYGDSIGDRMDGDIEVIAWQPLTAPYQPKGE